MASLLPYVNEGRAVVVTNPTCSQMLRVEYPRLLGIEEAKAVAAQTTDPTEFLASLAAPGKLNRDFKTGAGKIAYHMPCHLRTQNIGYKTRDVLSLLPDTKVEVIEACSGHDGTWAMKKENFEASLRWGGRAFQEIKNAESGYCPNKKLQSWFSVATCAFGLSERWGMGEKASLHQKDSFWDAEV